MIEHAGDLAGAMRLLGAQVVAAHADLAEFVGTVRRASTLLAELLIEDEDGDLPGLIEAIGGADLHGALGDLLDTATAVERILPIAAPILPPALVDEARAALTEHVPLVRLMLARLTVPRDVQ